MRTVAIVSVWLLACWLLVCGVASTQAQARGDDAELKQQLARLRQESPGEYEKVKLLLEQDREAAVAFLRERFGGKPAKPAADSRPDKERKPEKEADKVPGEPKKSNDELLPRRSEKFTKLETLEVGEFSIDLCRREDGAFGLGAIRQGDVPLRRDDFLITWHVDGNFPVLDRRDGLTIFLRQPRSTLTFTPEKRKTAGTTFVGFRMRFQAEHGPIVETASWELGGSTRGLTYFDGYRGWHAPPAWMAADAVPPTNPKLLPALLQGTGFQFEHGPAGALLHFHTSPGDRLRSASRGESLEFETTFYGSPKIDRFVFVAGGDSRINLWTRGYEIAQAEIRSAFDLPKRRRELFLQWPPFSRQGFRDTARECAAATARDGFAGASIDVIWDNADFHGGAKNMNVWDYVICPGYGGEEALKELIDECDQHHLLVMAWVPAGHLAAASPVWRKHPDWLLTNERGEKFQNPSGLYHGALDTPFRDYFRDRVVGAVQKFGLDGLWIDTHLPYAQQSRPPDHPARLAALYRDFIDAGASQLVVEGDASALGGYGIAIGDDWEQEWGKVPPPELYYDSMLGAGSMNPRFYLDHFRRYVASGAMWVINWDFLYSAKLEGDDIDAARREVRQVVQDYWRVKDRMFHRFVHDDGGGYTWTNDRDKSKVVWLLEDAPLLDGRQGKAGGVYVVEPDP